MSPLGWPREILKRLIKLSVRPFDCGWHLSRYWMYSRIGEFFSSAPRAGRVLSISESVAFHELFARDATSFVEASYPDHNILSLEFESDSFDFVVCDQVLEHVEGSPQRAVDELRRVLRPGGWMLLTTCFINPVHGAPGDFWRFTPDGLRLLCGGFSAIDQCEGWGNAWLPAMRQLGVRGLPVPHAKWHPIHRIAVKNDPIWPLMTWVIAKK